MSLRDKMVETMYKAATSSLRTRILLTPLGPIVFSVLIWLFIVMFLQVDKVLGFPKLFSPFLSLIISIPIMVVGLFFWTWSFVHFIRAKGTPVPFNPPPILVATGPYVYVRNPMVIGLSIVLLGFSILLRSITLTFIFTPLFVLLNAWELKAIEEPELEKRLGKEYIEYKKKVPMFIPRLKGKAKIER